MTGVGSAIGAPSGEVGHGCLEGFWPCPFRGFHCCPDGLVGSKGIQRLVAHIKRLHLCSDERKGAMRDVVTGDWDLFVSLANALKVSNQWLCGECMSLHSTSRDCHHPRKVIKFKRHTGGVEDFLVGIPRPHPPIDVGALGGMPLDATLLDRIFGLPIKTVKSIPHSYRMAFAHALSGSLCKVASMPDSIEAWVRLLVLPLCTLQLVKPSNRRDRRSGNRKSLQCMSIQRALATWGDGSGCVDLIQSLLNQPMETLSSSNEAPFKGDFSREGLNAKQCIRKVADGHFTAAVKVLCSSGVAPFGEATMNALLDKHPILPSPALPEALFSEPPLVVDIECVLGGIKSFPKGTSCSRDGLRAQHILDALCGEGSAIGVGLLKAITDVVNLWLGGRCPVALAEFVASAPLTPLLKPDKGIRPIAVGAIWRRLVSKVAMKSVRNEMAQYLGDFQFGVGIPNGAEAVLHSANRFLNKFHSDGSMAMLTVDFSNAFNLVDRNTLLREVRARCPSISLWVNFLYGQPARLYVGNDCIQSTTGVQQGDPLGPLLFALALHPLIHRVRDNCKLLFHAWYLDDGTIIGNTTEVAKALDIIRAKGPSLGLMLNIKKTEVFWPSCNGVKTKGGLFPVGIGRPELGVKLLGGAVSRDASFISSLAIKRASDAAELMRCLTRLHDPQCELLLLRSCMGVAKLLFGLRTCQPMFVKDVVSVFDKGLRQAIEDIVVCGGPFFGDFQWRLASLPIRFGGLGLYSAEDVSTYAFVASRAQSWKLQDHILRNCGVDELDSDFGCALDCLHNFIPDFDLGMFANKDTAPPKAQNALASALYSKTVQNLGDKFGLSTRQSAVLQCLQAPHAQDFLTVIPIEGLGQHMSAVEYRAILKYRLMIPLFPVDEPCPICRKVCLDKFGEHALHCKELPGFKYRHDLVRDVLCDVLKRAGISAKKEAPVNFLSDPCEGRSTLRPADVLVFGWAGGKHACVDLTGVSPLVGLRDTGFVARQAVLKAEAGKIAKHDKACVENQHAFIPFAFDTFGSLAPDAITFLKRVQQVVHSNSMTPKNANFVFSRIGFSIQKGVAAQLVARLPALVM